MENTISLIQAETALLNAPVPPKLPRTATITEARKVAQDFEAFFLAQTLQPMFRNISAEEPFGGGAGEKMWRSLQIDEYGKAMAQAGGIGIADAVMEQIIRTQEFEQQ